MDASKAEKEAPGEAKKHDWTYLHVDPQFDANVLGIIAILPQAVNWFFNRAVRW